MRIPVSWLREYVDVPADAGLVERTLTQLGIEVEEVVDLASTVEGPLRVGLRHPGHDRRDDAASTAEHPAAEEDELSR